MADDDDLNEGEAIERYDRAGGRGEGPSLEPVRWPDVLLTSTNVERLCEGVLSSRLDFAREAFGQDFDAASLADRLEEAWRHESMQMRFAPEGVFVRTCIFVRVTLFDEDGAVDSEETLQLRSEMCLSFSTRRHSRPFVDFMRGSLVRHSDGAARAIDPFALMVEPQDAVDWGLNGA